MTFLHSLTSNSLTKIHPKNREERTFSISRHPICKKNIRKYHRIFIRLAAFTVLTVKEIIVLVGIFDELYFFFRM